MLTAIVLGFLAASFVPLAAATDADRAFESIANAYIDSYLRQNPEEATQLGDHRFDSRLTDWSAAGIKAMTDLVRQTLAELDRVDAGAVTGANRIDIRILRQHLDYQLFTFEELRPQERNPLVYNASLANSIYALIARESAPPAERLRSIAGRLAAIPDVVKQAETNLGNPARISTETAIDQTNGAISLVRDDLEELVKKAPGLRETLAPARQGAIEALTAYRDWLRNDLLPRSTGDFRLGEKLYRTKLRFALGSDLSPETILARAEAQLEKTTVQLYETAVPLYRREHPEAAASVIADRPAVIRAVLDRLAEKSLSDDTIVDRAKESLKAATEFVRAHHLVTLPDAPVQIIVAPEFNRGVAVAYCDSPGALEPRGETFFAIAPAPADWPAARKESLYREYNEYMLQDLTVHEAMPGHYLQLAHSNQFTAPTLVRALFGSGSFIEGWAVYMERVMAEAGFGGPEVRMQQLKMRLRAIINAIIDQKIHMGSMSEQQAIDLMMKRGFQEEGEAVGKWKRARLTSTQLSTYFVGTIEHDDLRAAAEKREGASFDLQRYHDAVLSFGSPNVKYVREAMGL